MCLNPKVFLEHVNEDVSEQMRMGVANIVVEANPHAKENNSKGISYVTFLNINEENMVCSLARLSDYQMYNDIHRDLDC